MKSLRSLLVSSRHSMASSSSSSSSSVVAARRLNQIGQHMMASTSATQKEMNELDAPVLFESNLSSRMYKLNRPKKFNSLNQEMVDLIAQKLDGWKSSDLCKVIIGVGGTRPFCAGGDVGAIAKLAEAGRHAECLAYFKDEFQLDYDLAKLTKPYIAIMEGVTMGGGAGLCYPALFRIATSTTEFAMPETKIGFAPDVGSTYYLAQLDGAIGAWLAVTGQSVYGRSLYDIGLATHYVPQKSLQDLVFAIQQLPDPTPSKLFTLLSTFTAPPPTPSSRSLPSTKASPDSPSHLIGPLRVLLDRAFGQDSVSKIVAVLKEAVADKETGEGERKWAEEQLVEMDKRSPTGMKVALQSWRKARECKMLDEVMGNDLAMVTTFLSPKTTEMITGINHVLVKRSKEKAVWTPSSLDDPSISEAIIAKTFYDRSQPHMKSAPTLSIPSRTSEESRARAREGHDRQWGRFREWGLPAEEKIMEYITGTAEASDAFAVTSEQLEMRLWNDTAAKMEGEMGQGVEADEGWRERLREKVREVVERKCRLIEGVEGDGKKYLKWVN